MSAAKGRPVLFADPSGKAKEVQDAKDQQEALVKQEEFNRSPTGQLLPVAGSIAGAIGANELFKMGVGSPPPTVQGVLPNGNIVFTDGTIKTASGEVLNSGATQAANSSFASAASEGASGMVGPPAPAIPAASTGVEVGGATPLSQSAAAMGPTPFYVPAAAAIGTYLAGKSAYDMIKGKEEDKSAQGKAGRGQLAISSGGLSEVARFLGIGGQKSTREETADKTNELLKQSEDPNYQAYVQGMREQYKEAPTGPAYAGKYNTFNEYKQAGLDANDLTGVYGNIKAFGPEWANMSQEQRVAVTKGIIDAGLYDSKKGDVIIKDENKAREIKDQVLTGFDIGTQSPQAQAAAQGAMALPRPISNKFKKA